ncbi:hypothetical protein HWV01_11400 [Moritella sp. 5]|uniref:Lpp/OprI family alanine-zipper lipoprotein n=1 Tax=Moritella sp. 5 TaxID=2746231 RepID=UPI001BA642DE|nr:Lpp/OprI family alanine-zipper lipoprotein [Moritella sp. 5]QUM80840.1 hypothetical protein HWV01_11400 [Moritella sp. 5]
MNSKLLIAGLIVSSALIGGCANNADLENSVGSLTSQVSKLTSQVKVLESEQGSMKSDIGSNAAAALQASEEAQRANSRIDNIAASYSK